MNNADYVKNMKQTGQSAFTLIEVLISLTLLTVVLGAVYSSFFSVQRALERFDSISLKYHEARTSLDIMRREIESALIKNPSVEDEEKAKAGFIIKDRDIFGKNTSSLDLTAFSFRGNSLNVISYYVVENNGELILTKKEAPGIAGPKEFTVDIIENIKSFTVETLFNNKWVKTWDAAETGKLPEVVRLSIEFDDNGKTVKLAEYAKPRIGTEL